MFDLPLFGFCGISAGSMPRFWNICATALQFGLNCSKIDEPAPGAAKAAAKGGGGGGAVIESKALTANGVDDEFNKPINNSRDINKGR